MKNNIKLFFKYFLYRPKHLVWRKKGTLSHPNIKIVFLVQFPETWNSMKTVYESLSSYKDVQTTILCIPKPLQSSSANEYRAATTNEAFEFFSNKHIECTNAYTNSVWMDLEALKPHYVIYTRPYNKQYPDLYKSNTVCRYAKTCYLPYAFNMMDELFYTTYHPEFISTMFLSFIPCESRYELCKKEYFFHNKFGTNKFLNMGYPRFDLLADNSQVEDRERFTVAWMPRWTIPDGSSNKPSGFLKYCDSLLEFAEKHAEMDFIIRPHPLMFSTFIEKGVMTQEQLDRFHQQCNLCGNVFIDSQKDYLPLIKKADVLVADYTSLLIEFFVTKKPIIYCDNATGLNREAQKMDSALYHADNTEEIESMICNLYNGNDVLLPTRIATVTELLPTEAGTIGQNIAKYLIDDIKRGIKHETL